ncbi:unnamed protein product [Echinostoma caproni]|uniref:UMA domain-containing protein n=1 Tax=Echinostoma caproni TaxID=27848 RepID=A0A183BCP5_9TREM|nr:unnamed protein product [Echinostoma caproni]
MIFRNTKPSRPDNHAKSFRYLLDARTNVVDMPSSKFHRDKFESIVDANDRLLERLDSQNSSQLENSSDNVLTLISSPNLIRPQSQFSTPPDNSPAPFRPKLINKPHSLVALSATQFPEDGTDYPHPYQVELEHFASRINDWEPVLSEDLPGPLDSRYEFVNQLDQLQRVITELSAHRAVAVDLEVDYCVLSKT